MNIWWNYPEFKRWVWIQRTALQMDVIKTSGTNIKTIFTHWIPLKLKALFFALAIYWRLTYFIFDGLMKKFASLVKARGTLNTEWLIKSFTLTQFSNGLSIMLLGLSSFQWSLPLWTYRPRFESVLLQILTVDMIWMSWVPLSNFDSILSE